MSATPNESHTPEILVCPDPESVAIEAAKLFVSVAADSIRERGRFTTVLSGGSTPRRLFQILATPEYQKLVDWAHVHLFWGDERYVPADHPDSNFRMTLETLLSQVPIPPANVHRIRTELSPAEAVATNYEAEIARFFSGSPDAHIGRFPSFDLVYLGLGTNAHTASLFPHSRALQEHSHLVVADYVEEVGMWRITMTAPLLNAARTIAFLVCGPEKASVLREVLLGDYNPERKPAQLIQPVLGLPRWILDRPSAAQIPAESYRAVSTDD